MIPRPILPTATATTSAWIRPFQAAPLPDTITIPNETFKMSFEVDDDVWVRQSAYLPALQDLSKPSKGMLFNFGHVDDKIPPLRESAPNIGLTDRLPLQQDVTDAFASIDATTIGLIVLAVYQGAFFTSLARMMAFLGAQTTAENSLRTHSRRSDVIAQQLRKAALNGPMTQKERNTVEEMGQVLEAYKKPIELNYAEAMKSHKKLQRNLIYRFLNFVAQPVLEHFKRPGIILPPEAPKNTLHKLNDAAGIARRLKTSR